MILEDNEPVIKMCIKQRAPAMRHMARTLRINLDWLFERITEDPCITIKYISTKMQLADILTKAAFSVQQWNALLVLIQTRPYTEPLTGRPEASKSANVCEYDWIGEPPGIPPHTNHRENLPKHHHTQGPSRIYP